MILSFKTEIDGKPTGFVEKIQAAQKIHTLRTDTHHRWQPGIRIDFSTGVRSPKYKRFMVGQCTGIQEVRLNNHGILTIQVDGRFLSDKAEYDEFVRNDGFATQDEFEAWFAPLIEKNKGPLYLRLIHWTAKRY